MIRFLPNRRPDNRSEEELLRQFQESGDTGLLGLLYEPYVELIYGLCLKYFKNQEDAEDAVMGIFERLVEKLPGQEVRDFRPWLYVLAKNYCLMELRRVGRQEKRETEAQVVYFEQVRHPIDEALEKEATLDQLEDCLGKLAEDQRACVQAFYLEGRSYREIADAREEPLGRVRSYIQNGRRNLRNCMEKQPKETRSVLDPTKRK